MQATGRGGGVGGGGSSSSTNNSNGNGNGDGDSDGDSDGQATAAASEARQLCGINAQPTRASGRCVLSSHVVRVRAHVDMLLQSLDVSRGLSCQGPVSSFLDFLGLCVQIMRSKNLGVAEIKPGLR